jgi:hypothetical protein
MSSDTDDVNAMDIPTPIWSLRREKEIATVSSSEKTETAKGKKAPVNSSTSSDKKEEPSPSSENKHLRNVINYLPNWIGGENGDMLYKPYKMIWRYKNRNGRLQWNTYVFVGNVEPKVRRVLEKFTDLSLFDTLTTLSQQDREILEKPWGVAWFRHFFITAHMEHFFSSLHKTPTRLQQIEKIMGVGWVKKYEVQEKVHLVYNYGDMIRDDRERRALKKLRSSSMEPEEDEIGNFSIDAESAHLDERANAILSEEQEGQYGGKSVTPAMSIPPEDLLKKSLQYRQQKQVGFALSPESSTESDSDSSNENSRNQEGGRIRYYKSKKTKQKSHAKLDEDGEEIEACNIYDDKTQKLSRNIGKQNDSSDWEHPDLSQFQEYADDEENLDLNDDDNDMDPLASEGSNMFNDEMEVEADEIEKIYHEDIDTEASKTGKMIQTLLEGETKHKLSIPFDTRLADSNHDQELSQVCNKHYVFSEFLYGNDTIRTIKNKLTCVLQQDPLIDSDGWIIPSRQYLWGQYKFKGKNEQIMLGQKWIKRYELLTVDVIPSPKIHLYEKLQGNLRLLFDNVRRVGSKIRREDDENLVLEDYQNFMSNNEFFMVDLYHELGPGWNPKDSNLIRNMYETYVRIYFNRVRLEDMKQIIEYLATPIEKVEKIRNQQIYDTVRNDMQLEHEAMEYVEHVRNTERKHFENYFEESFITQSVIHVNLFEEDSNTITNRLELYRIFDSFTVNEEYPFVQRQMMDYEKTWKFHEKTFYAKENISQSMRWFENAPHGLSFRLRIPMKQDWKYISITLTETGRIEYKTQWKEDDMATIKDIEVTYDHIKDLIRKINDENRSSRLKLRIPENTEFKYAFINTIQKFILPQQTVIDHNDLSDFARYCFPYVALQVDPRKREAKSHTASNKGKYGTYLRFKRVSRYDNQVRMEHRIIYFLRNFEFNDSGLAMEIAKQFNITEAKAMEEILWVRKKYPNLKRSRKIMKKLESSPRYKPPGIEIAIQGKEYNNYKIRISGARDQYQSNEIVDFMNVLLYLYYETYIRKDPKRQILKDKLKGLTDIARRRNRVEEIVKLEDESTVLVKQLTQMDKKRLGFKPEEGENQWSRSCQNSGDDKRRQPNIYAGPDELKKVGFKPVQGAWLKTVKWQKKTVQIRAIKLIDYDDEGSTYERWYACDPETNGEHMHIGFLTRSLNPYGLCMPCCYKKDHAISKNKEKKLFFDRCLSAGEGDAPGKVTGDKLYILQDTNKIQDGRISFLPRYLDVFFNVMHNKTRKLRNHYLLNTGSTGYIFKYGVVQEDNPYLNAVASCLNITQEEVKNRLINMLEKDDDRIFISLNNGDLKSQFQSREALIKFIQISSYLDWDILSDLIAIPGAIIPEGMNVVILEKNVHVIRQHLEKERIKEDYYPVCTNMENLTNLSDPIRKTIILMSEGRYYYPLANVVKLNDASRDLDLNFTFSWGDPMMLQLYKYYRTNCCSETSDLLGITQLPIAKRIAQILETIDPPRAQFTDKRNRCRYLLTKSGSLIPTRPSGTLWNLAIRADINKYLLPLDETVTRFNRLQQKISGQLPISILGVFVDEAANDKVHAISLKLNYPEEFIPLAPTWESTRRIQDSLQLTVQNRPVIDKIDKAIELGKEKMDQRMLTIGREKFNGESYELFRLELSDYLDRHAETKQKLMNIIDRNLPDKKLRTREFLLKLVDTDLWNLYRRAIRGVTKKTKVETSNRSEEEDMEDDKEEELETVPEISDGGEHDDSSFNEGPEHTSTSTDLEEEKEEAQKIISRHRHNSSQAGGVPKDRLLIIRNPIKEEKLAYYRPNNQRTVCNTNDHPQCSINPHCSWIGERCRFTTTKNLLLEFVNKVSEELSNEDPKYMKKLEILRQGDYFVSDIGDYNQYTERPGQRVVRSNSSKIASIIEELFGKEAVPKMGKRKVIQAGEIDYVALNLSNPPKLIGEVLLQLINPGQNTIYRAYVNGHYWINHPHQETSLRNLGFYSQLQTQLSNYYKNSVIQWIRDKNNREEVETIIVPRAKRQFNLTNPMEIALRLAKTMELTADGWIECYVMSRLWPTHPLSVYNENLKLQFRFIDGKDTPLKPDTDKQQDINLVLGYHSGRSTPDTVETMYFQPS